MGNRVPHATGEKELTRAEIEELLFDAASVFSTAEERNRFLSFACRNEPELFERVRRLLGMLTVADDFFEFEPQVKAEPSTDEENDGLGVEVGRYRLIERIGSGGCGVVYLAEQREPVQRKVALKIIRLGLENPESIARFEAERQALASMNHPNIARVLDAGTNASGRPFFVMELVDGEPITAYCNSRRLGVRERLQLFVRVCQAIQHAHQKGVVHRDIKPANVPFVEPLEEMTRTLRIYNDTFSDTAVDVTWELRQDSAAGTLVDSGVINATVPLGYTVTQDISFTIPDAPEDTEFYLVLSAEKGGVELFREEDQKFTVFVFDMTQVTGTAFGTTPSWSPGTEFDKATDGNLGTYFDYLEANGGHTGIDLGAGNAARINAIIITPRTGFEYRMDGGQFQGSNDGTTYTTFHTVSGAPSPETLVLVDSIEEYRYLRYLGPDGSYCNIAEMAFYTDGDAPPPPPPPFVPVVSASTTAPATDADDAFFLPDPAVAADGNNISGGNDEYTYVAHDRPSQGMSFTTGSNPAGYALDAITFRTVSYGGTFIDLQPGDQFQFAFGELDGTSKSPSFSTAVAAFQGFPPGGTGRAENNVTGQGEYFTINLSGAGIELLADTTYYFEFTASTGAFFVEWEGSAAGGYADGEAFGGLTGSDAVIDSTFTPLTGDRAFHAAMTALVAPVNDFASWIAGYDVGGLTASGDDPDGDGLTNAEENFFGTDPSVVDSGLGLGSVQKGVDTLSFQHPQNPTKAIDVTGVYRWSPDLMTWNASGASDGSTTVTFDAVESGGTATVTGTITGIVPPKLFSDIQVTGP